MAAGSGCADRSVVIVAVMNQRVWADFSPGCDGVELLQARFERHVYDRHIHDTYAIGVTLHGVQRFWCRGAYHDSTSGHVIVIRPGEAHDGRSGAAGGYAYRMFYVRPDVLQAVVDETRPETSHLTWSGPLVSNPAVFNLLNACWTAMAWSPSSLASDELLLRSPAFRASIRAARRRRAVRKGIPLAEARRHGRSQYGWLKLVRLAIDLITTFRTWPLRLASFTGFLVMLAGLAALTLPGSSGPGPSSRAWCPPLRKSGARQELLAISIEQLTNCAGKPTVRAAAAFVARQPQAGVEEKSSVVVSFPEFNVECRYVQGGGLDEISPHPLSISAHEPRWPCC